MAILGTHPLQYLKLGEGVEGIHEVASAPTPNFPVQARVLLSTFLGKCSYLSLTLGPGSLQLEGH